MDKKHNPAPKAQKQVDGRKPSKGFGTRGQCPSRRKGQNACKSFLKGKYTNPSCDYCNFPFKIYISVSGCKFRDQCQFRHTEADGRPSKKSKKGDKGSVAFADYMTKLDVLRIDFVVILPAWPRWSRSVPWRSWRT